MPDLWGPASRGAGEVADAAPLLRPPVPAPEGVLTPEVGPGAGVDWRRRLERRLVGADPGAAGEPPTPRRGTPPRGWGAAVMPRESASKGPGGTRTRARSGSSWPCDVCGAPVALLPGHGRREAPRRCSAACRAEAARRRAARSRARTEDPSALRSRAARLRAEAVRLEARAAKATPAEGAVPEAWVGNRDPPPARLDRTCRGARLDGSEGRTPLGAWSARGTKWNVVRRQSPCTPWS